MQSLQSLFADVRDTGELSDTDIRFVEGMLAALRAGVFSQQGGLSDAMLASQAIAAVCQLQADASDFYHLLPGGAK